MVNGAAEIALRGSIWSSVFMVGAGGPDGGVRLPWAKARLGARRRRKSSGRVFIGDEELRLLYQKSELRGSRQFGSPPGAAAPRGPRWRRFRRVLEFVVSVFSRSPVSGNAGGE